MRKVLFLAFTLISIAGFAQMPSGAGNRAAGGTQNMNMGRFYGRVMDKKHKSWGGCRFCTINSK